MSIEQVVMVHTAYDIPYAKGTKKPPWKTFRGGVGNSDLRGNLAFLLEQMHPSGFLSAYKEANGLD